MAAFIKVYGERNTNTNYMSKLIKLNLEVSEIPGKVPKKIMRLQNKLPGKELVRDLYFQFSYKENLGWKHTCVKPFNELSKYSLVTPDLAFVTITKNPYSWLLSLHRRPYHQYYTDNPGFEEFLQRKWKTVGRDNTRSVLQSPVELWNLKNRSYLQLEKNLTTNTTTEDLFADPGSVINEISDKHDIKKKSDKFINFEKSTKDKDKDSNYYKDYYLKERWREKLSSEAIAIINESVDKELMAHFGYTVLD